jgi:hypothetical protein
MVAPYTSPEQYIKLYQNKRNKIIARMEEYKRITEERDAMILEAADYDFSYREIEEYSGMSHVTIRNIRRRNGISARKYSRNVHRATNERTIQPV